MKPYPLKRYWFILLLMAFCWAIPSSAQEEVDEEEVEELSPFVVEETDTVGYMATTTLAGTRLRTNMGDLGSAISVVTREFMEDVGATDSTELLTYTLNTEVGGSQGNYTGGANQSGQRVQPQSTQRVRGIGAASLTRNYFLTQIPFESYNSNRITINRGPNSLLFGIGTPGGVIDNGLARAHADRDTRSFSAKVGERGSTRFHFNVNESIINDRFGVRIAGLAKNTKYQQEPAFEDDYRLYTAIDWVIGEDTGGVWGRTNFRANYERGEIKSNRPNVVPPISHMENWFVLPSTENDGVYGKNFPDWVYDGSFVPKSTVDNRLGETSGQIPGDQVVPFFIQAALISVDAPSGIYGGATPDASILGMQGRRYYRGQFFDDNGDRIRRRDFFGSAWFSDGTGFNAPTTPYHIWDNNDMLISGDSNRVTQEFQAMNFTIEQGLRIFGFDSGFEFTYDYQTYDIDRSLAYSANTANVIRVDINQYWADGSPNPNVGRPFIETDMIRDTRTDDNSNEAHRGTFFIDFDLEERVDGLFGYLLGRHVATAYFTEQKTNRSNLNYKFTWGDIPDVDMEAVLGGKLNSWRRNVNNVMYIGPSLLDAQYQTQDDVVLNQQINAPPIAHGDSFKVGYWDPADGEHKTANFVASQNLTGAGISKQVITSSVVSLQSYLFGGNLVGLVGYRDDKSDTYTRPPNTAEFDHQNPDGTQNPDTIILGDTPSLSAKGNSFTWSIVGHLPDEWNPIRRWVRPSVHFGESENFSPTQARRNIDNEAIAPTAGTTKEYGFTLRLLDNKMSARFNWFETASTGATLGGNWVGQFQSQASFWITRWNEARNSGLSFQESYGFALEGLENQNAIDAGATDPGYTNYNEIINALINLQPEPLKSIRDIRIDENGEMRTTGIVGLQSTTDREATGFEIDLVGNITRNWRLSFNVGQQETVRANSAPVITERINQFNANLAASGLTFLYDAPNLQETNQHINRLNSRVNNGHQAALANDGQVVNEQRKWRWNITTNYTFRTDNWLDGLGLGGAVRYQDKVAIGYPLIDENGSGIFVPDLENPYWGPESTSTDLWASYRTTFGDSDKRYRFQLNVRNAFADFDPIPFNANPDGSFSRYRNAPTQEFWFTVGVDW